MRVSTKTRYAVSALADLAHLSLVGAVKTVPLNIIAERQELPVPYLEQIFIKLRKAGLIQSVRGAHGGYLLARSPESIRVADIVYAMDVSVKSTKCMDKSPSGCMTTGARCLTHDVWEGLENVIHHYFSQITLRHIIEPKLSPAQASSVLMEQKAHVR